MALLVGDAGEKKKKKHKTKNVLACKNFLMQGCLESGAQGVSIFTALLMLLTVIRN